MKIFSYLSLTLLFACAHKEAPKMDTIELPATSAPSNGTIVHLRGAPETVVDPNEQAPPKKDAQPPHPHAVHD